MDPTVSTSKESVGHFVAAVIAALAIIAVVAAATACLLQVSALPLVTEDVSWLSFESA